MSSNPYTSQFYTDLRARYPLDGVNMSMSDWVVANTKLNGRRFSYDGYEFQKAIVDDMSRDLCVKKPSQVGLSEVQIRKYLAFLARNRGTSGIFSFPNEKMFKSNSKTRFKPIVSQPAFSSSLLEDAKPQRAVDLYEVNGSFAHVTGMTEGDATSTPADILCHDELDLSNQTMIGLFQSRLQNSKFKITQKFSTPSFPLFGIDASYQASCQFEYPTRCRCGHWQVPLFSMQFLNLPGYDGDGNLEGLDADMVSRINLSESHFKCERCSQALDMGNPNLREWVASYPARQAHGYQVRPTSTGRLDPEYIIGQLLKMKQLDNLKGFYNTVLGETYSDGASKLEPDMVRAVMTTPGVPELGSTPLALGCDMGKTCHLVLGAISEGIANPVYFEQISANDIIERIEQLCKKFNIICGGVDRNPYTPTSEQIRDRTKGKVLPLEYRGQAHIDPIYDEWENLDYVRINRTKAIDDAVKDVRLKALTISGFGGLQQIVIEHMCDMARMELDEKPATWEKLTGNDHFMHAITLMKASIKVRDVVNLKIKTEQRFMFGLVGAQTPANISILGQPPKRIHV